MEELIDRISNLEYQVADLKLGFIAFALILFIFEVITIVCDIVSRKKRKLKESNKDE